MRSWLSVVAVGGVCALLVAGCGSESSSSPAASSSPSSSVKAVSSASLPVVGRVDQGRILMTIEHSDGGPVILAVIDAQGYHEVPQVASESTEAHAVWLGADHVLFDSERQATDHRHLYSISISDGTVQQLTKDPASQGHAFVAADGASMVFEQFDAVSGKDLGLQISGTDGSNAKAVTPALTDTNLGNIEPALSPDGKWVAFVQMSDMKAGKGGLFVIHPDGTGLKRLTDDAADAGEPSWSPDSSTILYTTHYHASSTPNELWTATLDGVLRKVKGYDNGDLAYEGDWSPDGNEIVFGFFHKGGPTELRLMSADGTNERVVYTSPEKLSVGTPDWGP